MANVLNAPRARNGAWRVQSCPAGQIPAPALIEPSGPAANVPRLKKQHRQNTERQERRQNSERPSPALAALHCRHTDGTGWPLARRLSTAINEPLQTTIREKNGPKFSQRKLQLSRKNLALCAVTLLLRKSVQRIGYQPAMAIEAQWHRSYF